VYALTPKQFEATTVDAAEQHERISRVDPRHDPTGEQEGHVDLAGCQGLVGVCARGSLHIVHIREPFAREQVGRDGFRSLTDAWQAHQLEYRRLRRWLPGNQLGV
jgi:hypothetical protein